MSFLKSLFGGNGEDKQAGAGKVLAEEEYKGFTIRATEMKVGREFQLSGIIEKSVGGELKTHRFIRADRLGSPEQAAQLGLAKGRQIIDEQGERLFA
jgi:hypothetical protein